MPGPAPKRASARQRRNRTSTSATIEAPSVAKVALPRDRVSSITCEQCHLASWKHTRATFEKEDVEPHDYEPRMLDWRPATLAWWDTIWASPIAGEWVDADVPGLLMLAVLVDEFATTGSREVHAELRMASREFGLSPLSRRTLQWEVKRVEAASRPTPAPPTRAQRRGRMAILEGGKASA